MGANGQTYYRSDCNIVQWRLSETGQIEIVQALNKQIPGVPRNSGVTLVDLAQGDTIGGGARVPGRLYVTTDDGFMYAIGQGQQAQQIAADQNAAPTDEPETSAPSYPSAEIAWTFQSPAGFSSGPAAADDGTIYVASKDGTLYALDPAGNTLWEATLPALSIGPPVLDAQGNVYLADQEGVLSAFAPDGSLRWRFTPPESKRPAIGPLVGPDGTIYYTVGSSVQAVSASGEGLWQTKSKTFRTRISLRLTTSGDMLFYADDAFDTRDGRLLELESPVDVDQYIAGNDGQTYLRSRHTVMQWQQNESSIEIGQSAQWNYESLINALPVRDNRPLLEQSHGLHALVLHPGPRLRGPHLADRTGTQRKAHGWRARARQIVRLHHRGRALCHWQRARDTSPYKHRPLITPTFHQRFPNLIPTTVGIRLGYT